MSDDPKSPQFTASDPGIAAPAPSRSLYRRHWGKLTLGAILVIPALVFTVWAGLSLAFTYSSGERIGFVQKLSKKGWICKTWEGELQMSNVPGSAPTLFLFTVREDSIAQLIQSYEGKSVSLHFDQHVGVPSRCFGDTEYFVTGVRPLGASR